MLNKKCSKKTFLTVLWTVGLIQLPDKPKDKCKAASSSYRLHDQLAVLSLVKILGKWGILSANQINIVPCSCRSPALATACPAAHAENKEFILQIAACWIMKEARIRVTGKWPFSPWTVVVKINLEPFCHLTFRQNDKVILMGGKHVIMSFIRECVVIRAWDYIIKHDFALTLEYLIYQINTFDHFFLGLKISIVSFSSILVLIIQTCWLRFYDNSFSTKIKT